MILFFLLNIFFIATVFLDILKKYSILNRLCLSLFLIIIPHLPIFLYLISQYYTLNNISNVINIFSIIEIILYASYVYIKLNFFTYSKSKNNTFRLRMLIGGRKILLSGLYALIVQVIFYSLYVIYKNDLQVPKAILIIDIVISVLSILLLIVNGSLKILLSSKRLNIIKRLIIFWCMFIPIINIFSFLYASHLAKAEYDHDTYKIDLETVRAESEICKTKYPLILIHGVGFRDLKYFNYWGRIPKELTKFGATVYYGNQEAWGTVAYNANDIKNKILEVLDKTKCEKVNIIAHSKGGLDARYVISKLNMGKYVASLTTISTPHRGVNLADYALHLPDNFYKFIAKIVNNIFSKFGDKNPDFYTATRQFSRSYSKKFNEEVLDDKNVYYQSYASVVSGVFSDYIVSIPYILMKLCKEGENDGLVAIDSAIWGEFKGVIRNKKYRGISHGDMIDLRREDYKDFDVIEKYVKIVSDLKAKGY